MKIDQLLKFEPILKEKVWGGEKLIKLLNKKDSRRNIGESWEISDIGKDVSVVATGNYKGASLTELIQEYKGNLVGEKVYQQFGDKFPLLVKFIDAKKTLSIQLHPNDELAKKRHHSFGKTEMWYIMQADKYANLIVGFKKDSNTEEYLHHLNNKSLLGILNVDEVKKGDVYFIPTGTIHAVGAGVLLAEIQQRSDITYRVYDWDRKDINGGYRDLHTTEALAAIDYKAKKRYNQVYDKIENKSSEIVSCPYFTSNILSITQELKINNSTKDSFVIYMCVEGAVSFIYKNQIEKLQKGETILIPANVSEMEITAIIPSELLEVYIK
ncbi:type I phosphomannose isomerase catalytic subunit [Tenacibaculum maritimum]|uniref:type I phosphomannose isomerase catalytic subunit n=1 Tax=Tenacibaculum maritimum TaxID=107401 RepID=UPI0010A2AFE7|nr:type I phosphomannose isomerase catalytic subunit [Tenacibaculum maritimum]MCD9562477.1 class I mannose-6-phosphate isomerase [Tenacibaculum maritimum]MCD9564447.1 class I mannose-6-phosphate isomerase [Tenacibaculum maritimum]MCD9578202.1 class I mannose-6-phosphate isomerase [Tenacibaculum maritimum]MCD9595597.1 class I mannose-6-phosphate isomerase [Tenacibaculum maritimum]MCD9612811.1 class I mannose-6-phosphate isomerase [Tenacibaculum maritimum]